MKEERAININELEDIIKRHYGYKSASIKRIWSGTRLNNMTGIDLGPGGVLDILLDVDDGKEDENGKAEICWQYKVAFLVPNRLIHMSPKAICICEKEGCVTWLEPLEKGK